MQTPEVRAYLERVCARIADARTREETQRELAGHIEDKLERLRGQGVDESSAAQRALEEMGEGGQVAELLGALHSRLPALDMNRALSKAFLGLLLTFFSLDIGFVKTITNMVGLLLIVAGVYQIRRANRPLGRAFWLLIANAAFEAVALCVGALADVPPAIGEFLIPVLGTSLMAAMIWQLCKGLGVMVAPHQDRSKPIPIERCGGIYLIASILVLWTLLTGGDLSGFPVLIAVTALLIYILVQVSRVRRRLWLSQAGYRSRPLGKPGLLLVGALAALLAASPLITGWIVMGYAPQTSPYSREDVADAALRDSIPGIKARMLAYEIPDFIVEDLPQSELLRYADIRGALMTIQGTSFGGGQLSVYGVAAELPGGVWRLMHYFVWETPPGRDGRDSLLLPATGDFLPAGDARLCALVLYEHSGKTIAMEPVMLSNAPSGAHAVAEYRVLGSARNQRGFIAADYRPSRPSGEAELEYGLVYVHRRGIASYPYRRSLAIEAQSFFSHSELGFEQVYFTSITTPD